MSLRRLMTALTIPCACVAAERAIGQDRSVYGPQEPATRSIVQQPPADARTQRLPVIEEQRATKIDMLESWSVGDKAEFGIGRFRVGEIARQRTHVEQVREDLMARENRAIAGAGLRLRFPG
jgi:hypothetical protein